MADFTVGQAIADYVDHLRRNGRRSADFYAKLLRRHVPPGCVLEAAAVDQLTSRQIEQWRDGVARSAPRGQEEAHSDEEAMRRRKASADVVLAVLRAALNLARRDRAVTGVQADGSAWNQVQRYKGVRRARQRFLSLTEQRELVGACTPEAADLVRAALYTGARFSELAALRAGDVVGNPPSVFIAHSKNGRSRHVRLEPEAARFFIELRQRAGERLLLQNRIGEAWTAAQARTALAQAWANVSARRYEARLPAVETCTFHELRHTAASRWVAAGLPLKFVAAQLGHASISMTERNYVHLSPDDVARAFEILQAPRLTGPSRAIRPRG